MKTHFFIGIKETSRESGFLLYKEHLTRAAGGVDAVPSAAPANHERAAVRTGVRAQQADVHQLHHDRGAGAD